MLKQGNGWMLFSCCVYDFEQNWQPFIVNDDDMIYLLKNSCLPVNKLCMKFEKEDMHITTMNIGHNKF